MEIEKIRNLSDAELAVEGNKTSEQLFRLRFQLNLGQTDVVKKMRILRKDVARIKTVVRERELGLHGAQHKLYSVAGPAEPAAEAETEASPKKAAAKKTAAKTTATAKAAAPKKTPAKKTAKNTNTKAAKNTKTKKEAR
ncbi:MAG TPA: 50S ribosomal protein L29 [Acidobacteriaceae bacterium]|nr:50S ribosomal protein L29 [Acidobacteriaceae bacterium]